MSISFFFKKNYFKLINYKYKKKDFKNFIVIKRENKNWVLNEIAKEYKNLFSQFSRNISLNDRDIFLSKNINLFIMSKYHAIKNLSNYENQIYFPYFHGLPSKDNNQKEYMNAIKKNISKISKIQITNSLVENFFLENSIPKKKFMRIPITVDLIKFQKISKIDGNLLRKKFNIPINSFVIGSFQKDGDGWGNGNKPKLIKGPDIFIKTVKILKNFIPELFVLLSGPSRGYVINNLIKLKIPYIHLNYSNYDDLIKLYKCINVYLICSREEGGPRAIMESFASNIPLVTTNVGQAVDMIKNNFNAFKSDEIDEEILANIIFSKIYNKDSKLDEIINNANITVKNNSYKNQIDLWKNFFDIKEEIVK